MTYDEAIAKAEDSVSSLEKTEALDMAVYREKAAEVKRLLDFCEGQLRNTAIGIEKDSIEDVH